MTGRVHSITVNLTAQAGHVAAQAGEFAVEVEADTIADALRALADQIDTEARAAKIRAAVAPLSVVPCG